MSDRLRGKVVLVTGGGTGIGAATARRLVRAGAQVAITGRRADVIERLASELGCLAVAGDVSENSDCQRMVNAAVDRFGGLDVLVANAGIEHYGSITEVSLENWREVQRVNVDGVMLTSRAAIDPMRRRGGGAIVIVGSVTGFRAGPHYAAYVVSKHAVIGLTRSMAYDYGHEGIRVNAICPGWVRTEMAERVLEPLAQAKQITLDEFARRLTRNSPLRRMSTPDEIASCIEFLASNDASFVTGAVLTADGGASVIDPGALELLA